MSANEIIRDGVIYRMVNNRWVEVGFVSLIQVNSIQNSVISGTIIQIGGGGA